MLEIIAKSKSAKRERMKEKEAADEQLDALDLTFKALAEVSASISSCYAPAANASIRRDARPQAGALKHSLRTSTGHLKAAKFADRRRRGSAAHAADDDDDDFDALVRMPPYKQLVQPNAA
jgi:hypothetical protein